MDSQRSQAYGPTYLRAQKGQVAVEYILLVALSVSIAVLLVSLVASRNKEDPGILTGKWRKIIELIASDRSAD